MSRLKLMKKSFIDKDNILSSLSSFSFSIFSLFSFCIYLSFFLLLSCKRDIYINDVVSIPLEDVIHMPSTLELLSKGKVRVKAVGNHEVVLRDRKIVISVQSLLTEDVDKRVDKILLPNNMKRNISLLIFSIATIFLVYLFIYKRKKKDLIKNFSKYKRELNREEMFALTLLFREYLEEKFGISKGLPLEVLLKELEGKIERKVDEQDFKVIEEYLKLISHPKYSGKDQALSAEEFVSSLEKIDVRI